MIDDIIDVTVTLSSAPDMYTAPGLCAGDLPRDPPPWATREERYAWRREVFDLLVPELEAWTLASLDRWQGHAPATPATLAAVKSDLDRNLRLLGVGDVFAAITSLDHCARLIQVGLDLTPDEVKLFGEQPPIDRD
jgi:hypothetical protein